MERGVSEVREGGREGREVKELHLLCSRGETRRVSNDNILDKLLVASLFEKWTLQ